MVLYECVIKIDPRTKKNHMMIVGSGKACPFCHKPEKQWVRQGKVYDRYEREVSVSLKHIPTPIEQPVRVVYRMYTKTRRVVDDLNLFAAVDDILVREGVLADDNTRIIRNRDGSGVFYDKSNPRTEITIYSYEEDENARKADIPD